MSEIKKSLKIVGPKVYFITTETEKTKDTGGAYLAIHHSDIHAPADSHKIYHLISLNVENLDKPKFYWVGLWNTCSRAGEHKGYDSIDEAIIDLLKTNKYGPYKVIHSNPFKDSEQLQKLFREILY